MILIWPMMISRWGRLLMIWKGCIGSSQISIYHGPWHFKWSDPIYNYTTNDPNLYTIKVARRWFARGPRSRQNNTKLRWLGPTTTKLLSVILHRKYPSSYFGIFPKNNPTAPIWNVRHAAYLHALLLVAQWLKRPRFKSWRSCSKSAITRGNPTVAYIHNLLL